MSEELRCLCGSLVARIKKDGIELKCRRCKRVGLIPFSQKEKREWKGDPDLYRLHVTLDHPHTDA